MTRMRVRILLVALVVAWTSAAVGASAHAQSANRQRDLSDRIRKLQDAIGEASQEEMRVVRDLAETQERLDAADVEVARLDSELGAANARLGAAETEVQRLDARYIELTRSLQEARRAADVARDRIGELAAALYRGEGGGGSAAALTTLALRTGTPHEVFAAGQYLSDAADHRREQLGELEQLRARITDAREELEGQREQARAARDSVAAERAQIARLHDQQSQARAQVEAERGRERGLLEQIRGRKDQYESEIAKLQAESSRIADLLRGRQSGQTLVPSGHGILGMPVNAPVTSGFGMRRHPILGTTRMHTGIDFGVGYGTPIVASDGGVVVWAGPRGGYGNAVIIDHGNALATLYAHQSRLAVSQGATVDRGQAIGYVGSTGMSTGPHLHFEVRVRGTPVDPLQYL